jgi:hypothetical protein
MLPSLKGFLEAFAIERVVGVRYCVFKHQASRFVCGAGNNRDYHGNEI